MARVGLPKCNLELYTDSDTCYTRSSTLDVAVFPTPEAMQAKLATFESMRAQLCPSDKSDDFIIVIGPNWYVEVVGGEHSTKISIQEKLDIAQRIALGLGASVRQLCQ